MATHEFPSPEGITDVGKLQLYTIGYIAATLDCERERGSQGILDRDFIEAMLRSYFKTHLRQIMIYHS